MSNYRNLAVHPKTGRVEEAEYVDNQYGHHLYGVRFADGTTVRWTKAMHRRLEEALAEARAIAERAPQ